MSTPADSILEHLQHVERERALRADDAALAARVHALKGWQQRRFALTYADLLASPRYAAAARFFLDELYGPRDYARRDAQFARVVPATVRLFPNDIVATVSTLAELHALSETLDTAMARHLASGELSRAAYVRAWQAGTQPQERERQIALTIDVGAALDRYTRKPLLRQTLRLMRAPARAAGLDELQHFLETGFDTFAAMRGAGEFLALVGERERALAAALFEADAAALETATVPPRANGLLGPLDTLP